MQNSKVLVIAGSARDGALSVKLAQVAAGSLRAAGAETTQLDLRALGLPLYDGDIEAAQGVPDGTAPAGLAATAGKPVALLSASPGPLGGLRALNLMRQFLGLTIGMLVVPQQFALGRAGDAFDADGALVDAKAQQAVDGVAAAVLRISNALRTS